MRTSSNRRQPPFDPTALKTNVAFIGIATLMLGLASWLMMTGFIPSFAETALSQRYSPWNTFVPFQLWLQLAVGIGIILPIVTLTLQWRQPRVRRMMALYLGVLLIQIQTERIFFQMGLPGMNYIVGFTYTSYRVWQLWCYQQCLQRSKPASKFGYGLSVTTLIAGILFWSANWAFLAINLVTRTIGV